MEQTRGSTHEHGIPGKADSLVKRLAEKQYKSDSPAEFEEVTKDAFSFLGFEAELIGGSGDTDVILSANIGRESFKVNVDCKTTKSGKIIDRQIDWISLRDHKRKNKVDFVVVVGPDFSGGNLEERAKEYDVVLLKTEDLSKLVQAHSRFPFTLAELKDLFTGRGDRVSQLQDLLSQNEYRRYLLEQFRIILEEMQSLQDRLGYFTIESLAGREKMEELEIEMKDIEYYVQLLELPFINALKKLPEGRYILTIKTADMANIFGQISKLLATSAPTEKTAGVPVAEKAQPVAREKKLGTKYYEWHLSGRSIVAKARKEDPYDHWCPLDHFLTILGVIGEAFKGQDLISAETIFSLLQRQDLSPGRPFKGKPEEYKIRMAIGTLEIEGLLKWTGSKRPFEYKLNVPIEKLDEWIREKIVAPE